MVMEFPKLDEALRLERLKPPTGRVRMVLDTDTYNEIDDQFRSSPSAALARSTRGRGDLRGTFLQQSFVRSGRRHGEKLRGNPAAIGAIGYCARGLGVPRSNGYTAGRRAAGVRGG